MEDYLKTIYHLQDEESPVSTSALAQRLGVAAPSVTNMVKRLHALGLVAYSPYRDIGLTPGGLALALEVVRHHRLIELYLAEFLDMPWEKVHAEAERLEHVISEELEERIASKLGDPSRDPHGDPIPSRALTLAAVDDVPLSSLPAGSQATVVRVPQAEPALLQYLATLGLVPGQEITLEAVAPFGGVLTVRVGTERHALGGDLARRILVQPRSASLPRDAGR